MILADPSPTSLDIKKDWRLDAARETDLTTLPPGYEVPPAFVLTRNFSGGARFLRSRLPVRVDVSRDGDLWHWECVTLHVFASGKDATEARDAFSEQVAHFWRAYADASDADLSQDARRLKATYAKYFPAT